jgi:hypothetical protein
MSLPGISWIKRKLHKEMTIDPDELVDAVQRSQYLAAASFLRAHGLHISPEVLAVLTTDHSYEIRDEDRKPTGDWEVGRGPRKAH